MDPQRLFTNQRHIRAIKLPADNFHAPYCFFNVAARNAARAKLSGGAFKLYDYFCSYGEGYHEYLGKKNIESKTGLSRNSYFRAFRELEQNNYIQHDGQSKNEDDYIFVEDATIIYNAPVQNETQIETIGPSQLAEPDDYDPWA